MSTKTLNTKFQLRRDTLENWLDTTKGNDPILADGEPVLVDIEGDGAYKLKIGDGKSNFSELPYYGGEDSGDADWVTLLNKPFYEKQIPARTYTTDFTKTPDATGIDGNNTFEVFKLSDIAYTAEEMKHLLFNGESTGIISFSMINYSPTDDDLVVEPSSITFNYHYNPNDWATMFISILQDDVTINGIYCEQKGLYAFRVTNSYAEWKGTSFTVPAHTELKKIDKKFLYLDWEDIENKPTIQAGVPQIQKMTDYLYYLDVNFDLDYDNALDYVQNHLIPEGPAEGEDDGNCTAFRKNDLVGRNLDWKYAETAEYIINTPATKGRHASIGVATGLTELTNDVAEDGEWNDLYEMLPFCMVDGINDQGVVIECNTVHLSDGTQTIIDDDNNDIALAMIMIPRYVLDYADSAAHAVELLQNVNIYNPPAEAPFDLHYLVADETETYVLEWLSDGEGGYQLEAISLPDEDHHMPISTNFYLHDYFDEGTIVGGGGKNRYDIIAANYEDIETQADAFDVLAKTYSTLVNEITLSERDGSDNHTTHSAVYNIAAKTLAIRPQPDVAEPTGKEFRFAVNNKEWATADWENITNKPFGEIKVPAKHYDTNDAIESIPPINGTELQENYYKEYYILHRQTAQLPELMSGDEFYFDYDLNGETITVSSYDVNLTVYNEEGEIVSGFSNGAYAKLDYTDEDNDNIITAFIIYKDLSNNSDANYISYDGHGYNAEQGDIFVNIFIKQESNNNSPIPIIKKVTPIKTYGETALIEYDFSSMSNADSYLNEGDSNAQILTLFYNIGELNLSLNDWKNATDFGLKIYDPDIYDPNDSSTYEIESFKTEFDEEDIWNNLDNLNDNELIQFTDDYDILAYIIQTKKANYNFMDLWTIEYPGVYLVKEWDYTKNIIVEAYIDLPARTEIKKLDKKYTYNSWNDLEDKPFGEIIQPPTTYKVPGSIDNRDLITLHRAGNKTKYIYDVTVHVSSTINEINMSNLSWKCIATIDGYSTEYSVSYNDINNSFTTPHYNSEDSSQLDYAYVIYNVPNTDIIFEGFIINNENGCDIEELDNYNFGPGMYVIKTVIQELNQDCTRLINKEYKIDSLIYDPNNHPCERINQMLFTKNPDLIIQDTSGNPLFPLYRVTDAITNFELDGEYILIKDEDADSESPNYGEINIIPAILTDVTSEMIENATNCVIYVNSEDEDIVLLNVISSDAQISGEGPGGTTINMNIKTPGLYTTYEAGSTITSLYSVGINQEFVYEGDSPTDSYEVSATDTYATLLAYEVGSTDFLTQSEVAKGSIKCYGDNILLYEQDLTPELVSEAWISQQNEIDAVIIDTGTGVNFPAFIQAKTDNADLEVLTIQNAGIYAIKYFEYDTTNNQVHNYYAEFTRPEHKTTKKIDSKYLPKGSGGGVASWNDLEDKPFEAIQIEKININTSLPSVTRSVTIDNGSNSQINTITFYKISDICFDLEDWRYLATDGSTMLGEQIYAVVEDLFGLGQTNAGSLTIIAPGLIEIIGIAEDNDKVSEMTGVSYTITGLDDLEKGTYIGDSFINATNTEGNVLTIEPHERIEWLDEKYIKEVDWKKITNPPFGQLPTETLSNITFNLKDFQYCGGTNPTINQVVEVGTMRYYRVGDAITLKQLQGLYARYYKNAYLNNDNLSGYNTSYLYAYNETPDLIIKELPNYNNNCYGVYYKAGNDTYPCLLNFIDAPVNFVNVKSPWQASATLGNANLFTSGLYLGIQETSGNPNRYNYIGYLQSSGTGKYYQKIGQEYLDLSNIDTTLTTNTPFIDNNTTTTLGNWVSSLTPPLSSTNAINDVSGTPTLSTYIDNKIHNTYPGYIFSTTRVGGIGSSSSLDTWVSNKITTEIPYTFNVSSTAPASGTPNTTITFII